MSDWNPNSTGTKGLEWPVLFGGSITVPGTFAPCIALRQTVSEATGSARIYLGNRGAGGGLYVLEAYDGQTAVASNFTLLTAVPNEDVSGVGTSKSTWCEDDGTTTNIYDQIDETTPNTSDWIRIGAQPSDATATYTGRFNTGALALTSKRILSVRMKVHALVAGWAALEYGLNISGTNYVGVSQFMPGTSTMIAIWNYNPATKLPWRIADVQALDTTDEFYLTGTAGNPVDCFLAVFSVWLEIAVVDENRLAFGVLDDTASGLTANGWNTVTLTTPTGGTWTKDGTDWHTYLMRRLTPNGSFSVPFLEAHDHAAPNPAVGYYPTIQSTYGYATAMNAAHGSIIGLHTRTTAPADSVDGQPYTATEVATVYTGNDAEGEFSNAAAAAYGVLRFLVNPYGVTADLQVRIRRRSDNVQLGGTGTLTVAQAETYPDLGGGWRYVLVQLASSATLAAGTQYYIEFQSSAGGSGSGATIDRWGLIGLNTNASGNASNYGGTTDRGTYLTGEFDSRDLTGTLSTIPTAPANFARAAASQAVDESVCGTASLPYTNLTWNATALGGSFSRYEVQRSLDGGSSWLTIGYYTTESTPSFADYEAPFGVSATYRIRVVRSDGAVSDWVTGTAITKSTTTPVLWLVSNYDPSYNLVLDHDPDVGYDFLEAEEAVVHSVYGQDASLGFLPIEDRGTRGNWSIPIQFNGAGQTAQGVAAFAALRELARAQLPYVAILDAYGNVLNSTLSVPSGSQHMPGRIYTTELAGTEVAAGYVVSKP